MKLRRITAEELNAIIDRHYKWLDGDDGGECAVLNWVIIDGDDSGIHMAGRTLTMATITNCNFERVDMHDVELGCATMVGTTFNKCNLDGASLNGAIAHGTKFYNCSFCESQIMNQPTCYDADMTKCAFVKCNADNFTIKYSTFRDCYFSGFEFGRRSKGNRLDGCTVAEE